MVLPEHLILYLSLADIAGGEVLEQHTTFEIVPHHRLLQNHSNGDTLSYFA